MNATTKIYFLLKIILAAFLLTGIIINPAIFTIFSANRDGLFLPFLWCYVVMLVAYYYLMKKTISLERNFEICLALLFMALLPRLVALAYFEYVPTYDFLRYFRFGQYVLEGNFPIRYISEHYRQPVFAGLAMLQGVLMYFFSSTLLGLQLANIFMVSFSCVLIYSIIQRYNKAVGGVAAYLYVVYPAGILSPLVTSNQHGALLFVLLSIYFIQKGLALNNKKAFMFISISAICVLISHFFHQSAPIVLVSLTLFLLLNSIGNKNFLFRRAIPIIAVFLLIFGFGQNVVLDIAYNRGIMEVREPTRHMLFKVYLGTSFYSRGGWYRYDDQHFRHLPRQVQRDYYLEMIRNNLTGVSFRDVASLARTKVSIAWFTGSSYICCWLPHGLYTQLQEQGRDEERLSLKAVTQALAQVDMLFTHIVYLFCIIYLVFAKKIESNNVLNIFLFIAGGWILFLVFTEVQSRYRYPAMPTFMIFAAFGLVYFYDFIKPHLKSWHIIIRKGMANK